MPRIILIGAFIAVLLLVVAGGHFYLAEQLVIAPALPMPWRGLALSAIALGGTCLVLQPIAERMLPLRLARWVSWPSSLWMGVAFLLLVGTAAAQLVHGLLGAAGDAAATLTGLRVSAALVVAITCVAAVRGVRTALREPVLERRELILPRWPPRLNGFRIVQLSDMHIGPILDRRFAARVVERCNALRPDLIAVTGDLVDGDVTRLAGEVAPFARLRAVHGVYFVTGNHDYYSGSEPWVAQVEQLGMQALRNRHVTIGRAGAAFHLAGVEDHHAHLVTPSQREDLHAALDGRDPHLPVVLLAHDPLTFKQASRMGVDLQLSGHTHGGQIWPFRYLVRLSTPYVVGHFRRNGSQLYVSRGTGFWGPVMRLFAPAEITEIVIRGD